MENKEIGKFEFDGDQMSVYGLIEDVNEALKPYGLELETDGEEHDGFDVAILSEIPNVMFTRNQVITLLHDYAMHASGKYFNANASQLWLDKQRPIL